MDLTDLLRLRHVVRRPQEGPVVVLQWAEVVDVGLLLLDVSAAAAEVAGDGSVIVVVVEAVLIADVLLQGHRGEGGDKIYYN